MVVSENRRFRNPWGDIGGRGVGRRVMEVGSREPENRSWTFSMLFSLRDLGSPSLVPSLSFPLTGRRRRVLILVTLSSETWGRH